MPTTNPPDIEIELCRQIWSVLEGYQPWSDMVDPGNRIKHDAGEIGDPTDEPKSVDDAEKQNLSDGDYPMADLEPVGGSSTMWESDQTFGTNAPGGPCAGWVEDQTHNFRLTLVTGKQSLRESSPLRKLTVNALRLAGPRLGLDYVTKWTFRWSLERRSSGEEDQTFRQYITVDLVVETQSEGRRLTGEIP